MIDADRNLFKWLDFYHEVTHSNLSSINYSFDNHEICSSAYKDINLFEIKEERERHKISCKGIELIVKLWSYVMIQIRKKKNNVR